MNDKYQHVIKLHYKYYIETDDLYDPKKRNAYSRWFATKV